MKQAYEEVASTNNPRLYYNSVVDHIGGIDAEVDDEVAKKTS